LSDHQSVADKVRALNLGAVDYMSKPFSAMELLSRTERALRLRSSEHSSVLLRRTGSDPLTGVADHRALLLRLDQEMARARRYGRLLSLAVLSPERPVHEGLRGSAQLLRKRLRAPDIIGHLGDGIFALVLPECPPEAGRSVISRLLPEIERETGARYRSALAEVGQDSDTARRTLERLGAPKLVED
jgi:PleD family two-component response regulator